MTDWGKHCDSCDQVVAWIKDQNGTKLLVNKTRARCYCLGFDKVWRFLQTPDDSSLLYHTAHFLTCPGADKHSRGGT